MEEYKINSYITQKQSFRRFTTSVLMFYNMPYIFSNENKGSCSGYILVVIFADKTFLDVNNEAI